MDFVSYIFVGMYSKCSYTCTSHIVDILYLLTVVKATKYFDRGYYLTHKLSYITNDPPLGTVDTFLSHKGIAK